MPLCAAMDIRTISVRLCYRLPDAFQYYLLESFGRGEFSSLVRRVSIVIQRSYMTQSFEQYRSLLLLMLWLLPLNAPTVLVWVRGIAVDWKHAFRFGSHWGLLGVIGFALLCEGCAGGKSLMHHGSK